MKKGRVGAAFPGRNPTAPVAGGDGEVGEELEETELYPFVGSDGLGVAGQGSATASGGRRRQQAVAAALRRGEAAVGWSGSFTEPWGSWLGGLLGRRAAGREGSAASQVIAAAMVMAEVCLGAGEARAWFLGKRSEE